MHPSIPPTPRPRPQPLPRLGALVALAIACACAACEDAPPPITACNGADALCDRRFDEVSYPCAHNAMSNSDDDWLAPNQHHNLPRQLDDGIRCLMLDTHLEGGVPTLCHGPCSLGSLPLADGLAQIRSFLDRHPREVVTLVFEAYVSAADTEAAFASSGLLRFAHAQPRDQPWPTLRRMIEADHRVVVFTSKEGGARPWYHDQWQYTWENPYAARQPSDFSCAVDRGDFRNSLFTLNHFLTNPIADVRFAEEVNVDPVLADHVTRCRTETGRLPNFVAVDFYDIGDLFPVVAMLNGLR